MRLEVVRFSDSVRAVSFVAPLGMASMVAVTWAGVRPAVTEMARQI